MNVKANLNLNPAELRRLAAKYRNVMAFIVVAAVLAYTAVLVSQTFAVQSDESYVKAQEDKQTTISFKSQKKTIEALKELKPAGDTSIPINLGKNDPFSLY